MYLYSSNCVCVFLLLSLYFHLNQLSSLFRAGKSTALGILTGDILPTQGTATICNLSLSDPATMKLIGYCPQVDPLLELMTGYELLMFFGRIRGNW